jgi:hypothetical protein
VAQDGKRFPFHPNPPTDHCKKNKHNLPHIHLLPPDDGPQMGSKHVEAWLFNKVKFRDVWLLTDDHQTPDKSGRIRSLDTFKSFQCYLLPQTDSGLPLSFNKNIFLSIAFLIVLLRSEGNMHSSRTTFKTFYLNFVAQDYNYYHKYKEIIIQMLVTFTDCRL